jgi:hypothetical protein
MQKYVDERNTQSQIYQPIISTYQNLKQLLPSTKQQIYMEENKVDHHQSKKNSPNQNSSFVNLNQFFHNESIKSHKIYNEQTTINLHSLYRSNRKPDESFCCGENTGLNVACSTKECIIF